MLYSIPNRALVMVTGLGILMLGTSFLVIPRGRELALLRFQTGDRQAGLAMLEERLAMGDRSPATLAALAAARAETGDVNGAARLLEEATGRGLRTPALLFMLEGLERRAGRTDQLVGTLVQLQEVMPSMERQREIARRYAEAGNNAAHLRAFRDLIRSFSAEPVEYVTLARLEAASGDPHAAVAVLQALAARTPQAIDASIVGLEIGLLLSAGEADGAFNRGRQWLAGRSDLTLSAPIVAGAFSVGGRPDFAVSLLTAIAAATPEPEIVAALAQAESDTGDLEAGLRSLEQLDANANTSAGQHAALLRLQLALAVQEVNRAWAAADRIGMAALPADMLLRLSELGLDRQRPDLLRAILAAADQSVFAQDPVIATRVALALGDRVAALRWSAIAAETVADKPDRAVQLAAAELQLGRPDVVVTLLDRAVANAALTPTGLRETASLYIRANRAEQGSVALDARRRADPSDAAALAWALTATASGKGTAVLAWLTQSPPPTLPANALQDLFYLATDAHAPGLALEAAGRLVGLRGSSADAVLLIRAQLSAGNPKQALAQMRAVAEPLAVPDELRAAVLLAAWRQKAPVAAELRTIWIARLHSAANSPERETAIAVLLELHAYDELMPMLRTLVEANPERWLWTFGKAATATRRTGELAALWISLGSRADIPPTLRRQLGFRLLETGNKAGAERIFRGLANGAPANSPDVRELLFIWGPRPSVDKLDWIEARARQAGGTEKVAWLRTLTTDGAAARAVAVYHAATGERSAALDEAYIAALSVTGDRTTLAAAVRDALPRTGSISMLQRLALLGERSGDPVLERQVLDKLVTLGANTPTVLRRLGVLAYQRRDMDAAGRHLLAYVQATGGDFETRMLLGDLAMRRRDSANARDHYAASLQLLTSSNDRTLRARTVMANLLNRLGREEESRRLYESLLAAHPDDRNLRADYVAMLMQQGALPQARLVLSSR